MGDATLRKKVKEGTEQIIGACLYMRHDMPDDQWEEQRHMQIEYANQEAEDQKICEVAHVLKTIFGQSQK